MLGLKKVYEFQFQEDERVHKMSKSKRSSHVEQHKLLLYAKLARKEWILLNVNAVLLWIALVTGTIERLITDYLLLGGGILVCSTGFLVCYLLIVTKLTITWPKNYTKYKADKCNNKQEP